MFVIARESLCCSSRLNVEVRGPACSSEKPIVSDVNRQDIPSAAVLDNQRVW